MTVKPDPDNKGAARVELGSGTLWLGKMSRNEVRVVHTAADGTKTIFTLKAHNAVDGVDIRMVLTERDPPPPPEQSRQHGPYLTTGGNSEGI